MNRGISSMIKAKAAILMLCVLFMVVNTCPIRSFLVSELNPPVESNMKRGGSIGSNLFVYDDFRCAEGKVTKVALLDLSKSNSNSLPFPLLLTIISLYLSLSVLSLYLTPFKTERKRLLKDSIPLFLKNRSIII